MSDPIVVAVVTALSIGIPATISAVAGLVVALKTRREIAANRVEIAANTAQTVAAAKTGEETHALVNGVKAQLERDLAEARALLAAANKRIADLGGTVPR